MNSVNEVGPTCKIGYTYFKINTKITLKDPVKELMATPMANICLTDFTIINLPSLK